MFKKLLSCALAGLSIQAASAAPSGWYDLSLDWRDGSFTGRILYDAASPYQVAQVNGVLASPAQTTAIGHVWNATTGTPVNEMPLTFTNWSGLGDPLDYNAAFSLVLTDMGTALAVADPGPAWGLYDWSNPDFALQVSDSPLTGWRIALAAQEVPEPAAPVLLAAGLFGMACVRRRRAISTV
jgi:hypothetical protein